MDSSLNSSHGKDPGNILPLNTIRRIMKSSPDMDAIVPDSIYSTTRATEMFVNYLTSKSYAKAKGAKELNYIHLANYVAQDDKLEFLVHIIPHKMTVKKARELMNKPDSSSDEDDDDEDDDDSDEDAEESDDGNAKIDLTMSDDD